MVVLFLYDFADEVKDWWAKLEKVNATIDTWLRVEKQWLDFYPIFICKTVRSHLHAEVLLFQVKSLVFTPTTKILRSIIFLSNLSLEIS